MNKSNKLPFSISAAAKLFSVGNFRDALPALQKCALQFPNNNDIKLNIAVCFYRLNEIKVAENILVELHKNNPHYIPAVDTLSAVYIAQGRFLDAVLLIKNVISHPENASCSLLNNLGFALKSLGNFEEATHYLNIAVSSDPSNADAHNNLCLVLLAQHRFAEAWVHHRFRKQRAKIPYISTRLDSLIGRRVRLHHEQGLGDTLFFLRYAKLLRNYVSRMVLVAQPELLPILQNSPLFQSVTSTADHLESVDIELSVGDLPELFESQVPSTLELKSTYQLEREAESVLANFKRPFIGITWRAGPIGVGASETHLQKQIALPELLKHLPTAGTVIVVQRFPTTQELHVIQSLVAGHTLDLSKYNTQLPLMHALLSKLDRYIAVSNTNIHLRAACGHSSDVLVPFPPEWRWGQENTSPWFPDHRLYRQEANESWSTALSNLAVELNE